MAECTPCFYVLAQHPHTHTHIHSRIDNLYLSTYLSQCCWCIPFFAFITNVPYCCSAAFVTTDYCCPQEHFSAHNSLSYRVFCFSLKQVVRKIGSDGPISRVGQGSSPTKTSSNNHPRGFTLPFRFCFALCDQIFIIRVWWFFTVRILTSTQHPDPDHPFAARSLCGNLKSILCFVNLL